MLVTIVVAVAVVWLTNRQKERAIENLTKQYLSAQNLYSKTQQEADQFRAQYEAASLKLSTADPDEKAKLHRDLEVLKRTYNDSQAQANVYQHQITKLREDQALVTSDHNALLRRIQDLQTQLNVVNAERDRLRSEAPALIRRIENLQSQLAVTNAAGSAPKPPAPPPQRAAARPTLKVIPQFSLVHLSAAPFAGSVAIAVGDVHKDNASNVRVYVWTTDKGATLPAAFHGRRLADRALDRLDRGSCNADGVPSCYKTRKIDVVLGHQVPGTFVVGGVRYEILATGWNNNVNGQEDSIALALYPAPTAR